jgi:hypothetical protein
MARGIRAAAGVGPALAGPDGRRFRSPAQCPGNQESLG